MKAIPLSNQPSSMEMKKLLSKAREFNGMIKTPEDLLNHLERIQKCSYCGKDFYDKVCPTCRDKLNSQTKPNTK